MSFPRYPKYKDSGVEWLGEVPEGWEVSQIKRTTYLKARVGWKGLTSEEFQEQAFAYLVTGSDFREKFVKWDECYQIEQERYDDDPFIQLENGDLLITKDGTIGKLAIVSGLERPACLNSGIFVVRPRNTYTTEFMYWTLSSSVFSVFCDLESFGSTINHLYQNVFERFSFPAPTHSEQTDIVEFLDRETAKIDELVAEQRRLMELLKEKRQAVISHAVTKGLNPQAPLKPSGIEWLGDVPEHWEIGKLNRLISTRKGIAFKAEDFSDQGVPVVKASDIKGLTIRSSETCLPIHFKEEFPKAILKAGEIVLSTVGSNPDVRNSAVGQIGKVPESLAGSLLNQNTVVFNSLTLTLGNDFLFLILQTVGYRDHLDLNAHGTANQASINVADMLDFFVPLPSASEQIEIAKFILEESAKFDTLTTEAQRAIDLLQERRTALISAAVTGQIDVRKS